MQKVAGQLVRALPLTRGPEDLEARSQVSLVRHI